MALGAYRSLFLRVVRDNEVEANARLRPMPERFHEAMEDGVRKGASSALAMVHL